MTTVVFAGKKRVACAEKKILRQKTFQAQKAEL